MTLTIHPDLIQGSDEWLAQRRGMITASAVGQLLSIGKLTAIHYPCPACSALPLDPCCSKVKRGNAIGAPMKTLHSERVDFAQTQDSPPVIEPANNETSRSLTVLLAAERITGWSDPMFVSDDMWRGIEDEPKAREKYAEHYAPVTEVGFITEDRWGFQIGYSPDGLVGDDGLIEIKSRRAKTQLATILADEVPVDNMAQLQCGLLVTGRAWIDYVSYCGGMPLYVRRVLPNPKWFDAITEAATAFEDNVAGMVRMYVETTAELHPTERIIDTAIRI